MVFVMLLNIYALPVAMDDEKVVAVGTVEACCELPDDLLGLFEKLCLDPSL